MNHDLAHAIIKLVMVIFFNDSHTRGRRGRRGRR